MADSHEHREGPQQTAWQLTAPRLLILSLLFHLVFLRSIFDVYFTSPVVQVADRFSVMEDDGRGLAKRVMLFVGDGLRADKLFQTYPSPPFPSSDPLPPPIPPSPQTILPVSSSSDDERTTPAPFVRSLIQSGQAQWGVSHTRVPTESRPGHVALIGGMYEDVSAVTRGWTTNPVPFDSVLNQSSHAFTFGSPDILPMFALGASDPDRVATFSYDEDAEDFTSDAVHLDLWVLDRLSSLLVNASSDPELKAKLDAPGVVFFEHLLGLDTTGHSYRPHGAEYHRNIRVVDYVVSRTVKLLSEYYGDDGETAFVFTADHGMSSLGNHGDGHPDNTRTPLVVWGKGVRRKEDWEEPARHDDYSAGWGLKGVRRDVEQADIAVLMAVLAGVPIPANSAGRLPLEYLDASPSFRARAAFANAQQLLAEAEAKSELKRRHALSFRPFPELVDSPAHGYRSPSSHRREIQRLVDDGEYLKAEKRSVELGEIALRASNYFQKYDWLVLRTIVTTGYVSFMLLAAHSILSSSSATTSSPSRLAILPIVAFLAFSTRFAAERSPFSYYLYTFFPSLFTLLVLRDPYPLLSLCRSLASNLPLTRRLAGTLSTLLILETMAYGYTSRRAFALIALAMGFVWPLTLDARWRSNNKVLVKGWMAVIGVLAVFPVLPVEKGEDLRVVSAGAAVVCGIGLVAIRSLGGAGSPTWTRTRRFLLAEIALTVACTAVTCSSALSLQRKDGLPALNQYAGWVVLVTSSLLPVFHGRPHGQPPLERLSVLLFAFGPAFTILSLSYEALFYACFCLALVTWLKVETSLARAKGKKEEDEGMGMEHVRISLFFLAFLHLGFFGCGNVASISSFYLEPVYRLMTVFAPFPMGALLLLKLLIPFVALSAVSSAINHHLRLPPLSLFLVSSILSEILTINFFFRVTDTGSWLEIGSSITNFVICSLLGLFSSALLAGGEGLLKGTAVGV
ncbi:phosphatidylinositol glycan, class N [Rhodotorula toruloides]|uniref:GPI ethanolamine phosphate transferase 1 n=1 Tax=Rhodotorula toruloides TaxID=5286 RepID=A0A511K870_RHOTO|nr:phosphatidylinositol glycan, class N [Rhodotorula toruloides]